MHLLQYKELFFVVLDIENQNLNENNENLNESKKKLIEFLRKLFQFDDSDLNFGIYKIMNYKRTKIESFIL